MLEEKGYDEASLSSSTHSVTRPQHELAVDFTSLLFPQWPCNFGQDVKDDIYLALETPFLWAYLEQFRGQVCINGVLVLIQDLLAINGWKPHISIY